MSRKITISITNYNRFDLTIKSFEQVLNDERVNEIVISDDASTDGSYNKLLKHFLGIPKVKLYRNGSNQDCYKNKKIAVWLSNNEWCILLDSDNIITENYLNKIFEISDWDDNTIYTPSFAAPHFDFTQYGGLLISKENVAQWVDKPSFETMLNAANFFVNRNEYLKIWDENIDPVTSDSIYMAYRWLSMGNKIKVVDGLKYFHFVHEGSHYQNNVHRTPSGFHEEVLNKLRQLV